MAHPRRLRCVARDRLRRQCWPRAVRLLFIGESPPASGRHFYAADSGLYRAMLEAFARAFPALNAESGFLDAFRGAGCALTDLCDVPVDHLAVAVRQARRRTGESRLASEIVAMRPYAIVTVVRSIVPNVRRAVSRAGWEGEMLELPYPGRWVQARSRFVGELVPALRQWAEARLLGTDGRSFRVLARGYEPLSPGGQASRAGVREPRRRSRAPAAVKPTS